MFGGPGLGGGFEALPGLSTHSGLDRSSGVLCFGQSDTWHPRVGSAAGLAEGADH